MDIDYSNDQTVFIGKNEFEFENNEYTLENENNYNKCYVTVRIELTPEQNTEWYYIDFEFTYDERNELSLQANPFYGTSFFYEGNNFKIKIKRFSLTEEIIKYTLKPYNRLSNESEMFASIENFKAMVLISSCLFNTLYV